MSEDKSFSILRGSSSSNPSTKLHIMFEGTAEKNKDIPAVLFKVNGQCRQHTYSEIDRISNKLAHTLGKLIIGKNIPKNDDGEYIIAVKMAPSDQLIMALLAIWKSGAAYLPLDHDFPEWRTKYILTDSKPAMIISDEVASNQSGSLEMSFRELMDQCNIQSQEEIKDERFHRQDTAIVLYTSGSTGKPKGVRLAHETIMNRLQWQFNAFPFAENEKVCVSKTAQAFVDSVAEIWGPLLSGRSLLVVPKEYLTNPEAIVNILDEYKVQRLVLVPSLLKSLLLFLDSQKNTTYLKNIKLWVCSGESLEKAVVVKFYEYFTENSTKLCNFYGSTETMADVTFYVIDEQKQLEHLDKVPIGIPIDNTIIYLLDEQRHIVPNDTVGEIFVSGVNLAAAYVNATDADERHIENPFEKDPTYGRLFPTGDFARIEDGLLIFEGRADSQVKIGGRKVDLNEIEQLLYAIEEVVKATVLCYKLGDPKQELLAFVTTNDQNISGLIIEAKLKKQLMWYMIPQVMIIKEIPLMVSGKIDRQRLIELYENAEEIEGEINYDKVTSAQMEAAKVLFETAGTVLSRRARSAISLTANFYEIGGNSLNSISTISKLREQGYHITIGDFISAENFAEILSRMQTETVIDNSGNPSTTFICEPIKEDDKIAVTDIIFRSLYHQPGLQEWIVWNTTKSDYIDLAEDLWKTIIEHDLSFVIKSKESKVIGICLNFDDTFFPKIEVGGGIVMLFKLMAYVEVQVRRKRISNGKGKAMNNLFISTDPSLSHQENVSAVEFIEKEMLNVARRNGFRGVLCTNVNKLTQQLAKDVLNYELVVDLQANQFIAEDGSKPFSLAPDDHRAYGFWKIVNQSDS